MKSIFLIFAIFFCIINISSQKNKTYSGEYTLKSSSSSLSPQYYKGKASYLYYDDANTGRVYNGSFSYSGTKGGSTWDGRSTGEKMTISISGNYKNGLKNGLFTTAITFKTRSESLSAKCKANYSHGYANGLWSITEKAEAITVNFVKNKGVGKFSYKTKDTKITGTMDEQGFIHGDLVWLSGTKWKETLTYDHGFQTKYVSLNRQTGEITETTLADPAQLESYERIQAALQKGDSSELENIPFRVKDQYYYGIYDKYNKIYKNYNLPGSLPGDLSESNDYKHEMIWDAFKIKKLEKQETRDERLERERLAKLEAERLEKERLEKERLEKERLAKLEAERIAKLKRAKVKALYDKRLAEFRANTKAIESKFKVVDPIATAAMGVDTYKTKRKGLYKSYKILLSHYEEGLNKASEFEDKTVILVKMNALCKRTLQLFDQKDKALEKALKKSETPEEIEKLMMGS